MKDALLLRSSDLRVREVNLVYEYTLNEKCFSTAMLHVNRPFASFPNLRVIQNAMIRVDCDLAGETKIVDEEGYELRNPTPDPNQPRLCQ